MSEVSLAVDLREATGKGVARKLRADGQVPGVLYGHGKDPVSISLDPIRLERLIKGSHAGLNTLIDLQGEGAVDGRTVIVKDLQRHPVRGQIMHADLFEVDLNARIRVQVPIHLRGTAVGVTMGGLLDHGLREIELGCLPRSIPDEIVVDVSELEQGHSIHVSDLALPEDVECHTQGDISVVSVVAPRVEEEAVVDEALLEGEAAEGEAPKADEAPAASEGEASE